MQKTLLGVMLVAACIAVARMSKSSIAEADPASTEAVAPDPGVKEPETILVGDIPAHWIKRVPPTARLWRHPLAPSAESQASTRVHRDEKVIYRNLGDDIALAPGPGRRIADDVLTELAKDCGIDRYLTRVIGVIPSADFDGETFDVTVSLMDRCPNLLPYSAPAIRGTEYRFTGLSALEDDIAELEFDFAHGKIRIAGAEFSLGVCADSPKMEACVVEFGDCSDGSTCVLNTTPPIIPPQFWVRLEFHSGKGGWLGGRPATRGFSGDLFSDILFDCDVRFGGFPTGPHGSFYGEAYAEDRLIGGLDGGPVCPTHFLAYLARNPQAQPVTDLPPGTDVVRVADDIEMVVDQCELSVIEAETKGFAGEYEIEFDLRPFPTDSPFLGPRGRPLSWTFQSRRDSEGGGRGQLEVARHSFGPGKFINQKNFWITWQANKPNTGVLIDRHTHAGGRSLCTFDLNPPNPPRLLHCNHFFMAQNLEAFPPGTWSDLLERPDGFDAVFSVAIFCRGEPPRGACCANQPDLPGQTPACIDDDGEGNGLNVLACQDGRWLEDATCPDFFGDPDPWEALGEPPCGSHSCCKIDSSCEDLPRDECVAVTDDDGNPQRWFRERFCSDPDFGCPWFACFDADNDCTASAGDPLLLCPSGLNEDCAANNSETFTSRCMEPQGGGLLTCTVERGCRNRYCCDSVCDVRPSCCTLGWDQECADLAGGACPGRPGNDNCWEPPGVPLGAREIVLSDQSCDSGVNFCGYSRANHENARPDSDEPRFCCHNAGVDKAAAGTVWYKFRASESTSARIFTCNSADAEDSRDSMIQVFSVADEHAGVCDDDIGACENTGAPCIVSNPNCPSSVRCLPSTPCVYVGPGSTCPDGSDCLFDERTVCETLTVIGCNDDAPPSAGPCGEGGGNASACVANMTAGRLYYIQVGNPGVQGQGIYDIDVEQPCPGIPPTNNFCESAFGVSENAPATFDLTADTLECPAEACLMAMNNDVWFETTASCTGNMRVETCSPIPQDPDPDTTLAVYRGIDCPPGDPLACNDDAVVDAENHELRDQFCAIAETPCDTSADCSGGICSVSATGCTHHSDCPLAKCEVSGGACTPSDNECPTFLCYGTDLECTVGGEPCPERNGCLRERCRRAEGCLPEPCVGSCGAASAVVVPVSLNEVYKIRVGGFLGGEPTGDLTIICDPQDCNGNQQADPFDISDECTVSCSTDLNLNGVPDDCDIDNGECDNGDVCYVPAPFCSDGSACVAPSLDCNGNGIPDEAEIYIGSDCGPGPFFCISNCDPDVNNDCIPDDCCPVPGVDGPDIAWDPEDGTVDARQPRLITDETFLLGIGGDVANVITVTAPRGAGRDACWSFCETQVEGPPNDIENIVDNGDDTYTITLQRPITAGAVSEITYTDNNGVRHTATYTALPADSDGSLLTERADIPALIDCCLDAACSPFGEYSCDINRSRMVTSEDLLRLIDLANSAGEFQEPWEGKAPDMSLSCPD